MTTDPLTTFLQKTLILDTETTSLDFKEAEVIQYASANVLYVLDAIGNETYDIPCSFYKPTKKIPPEISAITSITNRMVDGHPNFKDELDSVQKELDKYEYFVAHNAYYDKGILEAHDLNIPNPICTMRLAKKLYADDIKITAFNLSYLRYALALPVSDTLPAHLADADVIITGILFYTLIEKAMIDGIIDIENGDIGVQLVEWLDAPLITTIMPFGKHKGKKFTDVPISYWQWALDNFDSLNEKDSAYDKDFATSVAVAIEEILEGAEA